MSPTPSPDQIIFDVDLERFQSDVIDASRAIPILVDFWADWCAPCHALAPQLERAIGEIDGRVRLAKLEVDDGENMRLAGQYQLRGFPTVVLFQGGEEQGRFSGTRSTYQICDWLKEHLTSDADQASLPMV